MHSVIKIADRLVGKDYAPFIIAEMSANHNSSLERAFKIIDAAVEAGAHAIKLQTYTADTMTLDVTDGDFFIKDSLWQGTSLYELYQKAHTPWEWHEPIFSYCKKKGIIAFSSPFDETAVDFLESLNVPCYKIASFENAHLPLIKKVAATGKPVIISTGLATLAELAEAVEAVRTAGCKDLILLKCNSGYPSMPEDANLLTIPHMRDMFNCQVGLSDHSLGIGVAVASVALGATVIEKHFTLSRDDHGFDSAFSMDISDMKNLVLETERAWQALGKVNYLPTKSEQGSLGFRRSLYVAENIKKGELFTEKNIRVVRPAYGLHPRHYEVVLGKRAMCDMTKGTPLKWDVIE